MNLYPLLEGFITDILLLNIYNAVSTTVIHGNLVNVVCHTSLLLFSAMFVVGYCLHFLAPRFQIQREIGPWVLVETVKHTY